MKRLSAVAAKGTSACGVVLEALEVRTALCGTTAPLDSVTLDRVAQAQQAVVAARQSEPPEATPGEVGPKHAGRRRGAAANPPVMVAANLTTPTACAEEDNVNVPLFLPAPAKRFNFTVEARHPGYQVTVDHRDADFSDCPAAVSAGGGARQTIPVYDDHVSTAVVAVRDPNFHQPGMRVRVGGATVDDVHFIRVIRRVDGTDSWPEVMVLYSDGNLRLKPQAPPAGGDPAFGADPVFGSSVIVGPAAVGERPVAGINSVAFNRSTQAFNVRYAAGGKASMHLVEADRGLTRVRVAARYTASGQTPFATLRSMFVSDGNDDVDTVTWTDAGGAGQSRAIGTFEYGQGSLFSFGRMTTSRHNTSAPDILIGDLGYGGR